MISSYVFVLELKPKGVLGNFQPERFGTDLSGSAVTDGSLGRFVGDRSLHQLNTGKWISKCWDMKMKAAKENPGQGMELVPVMGLQEASISLFFSLSSVK